MSKIEYHSESREWYIAAGIILSVTIICYLFLEKYISPSQDQNFPLFSQAIDLSFLLLGSSGAFLVYQGYRFREGRAFLSEIEGDRIIVELEKMFLASKFDVKETLCEAAFSFGLWAPIGRLSLSSGEIEIKEIWFSAVFYRTQIALRGDFPKEVIDDFVSNSV